MANNSDIKSPFWQRKRLEALHAADFRCSRCENEERTLHVHHKHYVSGRRYWEYDLEELEVLCDVCHEDEHRTWWPWRAELIARLRVGHGPLDVERAMAMICGSISRDASSERLRELVRIGHGADPRAYAAGRLLTPMIIALSEAGAYALGDALMSAEGELCRDFLLLAKKHGLLSRHVNVPQDEREPGVDEEGWADA